MNISKGRIDKAIQLLSLESPAPLTREGTKWVLTATDLSDEFWTRAQRLTELRRQEQRQMKEYVNLEDGHMEFLIRALDGNPSNIDRSDIPPLPIAPEEDVIQRALVFLHRCEVSIRPRLQWPTGGLPKLGVRGRIPAEQQLSEGRCLCTWGDPGWGDLVRRGKYVDGGFSDELVTGLVELVQRWKPDPFPTWLTHVPSKRHPALVRDLAERLSRAMGLRFIQVITCVREHAAQRAMRNSAQQAGNVDAVFAILPGTWQNEAVFLIDDMIDSRWTMTVAGYLLRQQGSGPVYPLALALTANR